MSSMSNQELHRIASADSFQNLQSGNWTSGFLSPSSTAYEGRRDSVASSQSSLTYAQSFSSTISEMPMTPPPQRDLLVDEVSWAQCPPSFDAIPLNSSNDVYDECNRDGLLSTKHATVEDAVSFQNAEWVPMPQSDGYRQAHSFPMHHHGVLPAASDFDSALNALVASQAAQTQMGSVLATSSNSMSWTAPSTSFTYPSIPVSGLGVDSFSFDTPQYASEAMAPQGLGSMPCDWGTSTEMTYSEAPSTTIMPSEAVLEVDDRSYVHIHSDSFDSSLCSYDSCSSPMPLSPMEVCPKAETSPSVKEEPETEEYEDRFSRMYVSPTGRKGVKNSAVRSSAAARKKARSTRPKSTIVRLPNGPVQVFSEENIRRDPSGKWIREGGTGQKKWVCKFPVKGLECRRSFARPEHLKRHQDTHLNERKFECIMCGKLFGRNDNCLEHYWTHVERPDRKGRNPKNALAEIESTINKSSTSSENKKKIIDKLRSKWAVEVQGQKKPSKI